MGYGSWTRKKADMIEQLTHNPSHLPLSTLPPPPLPPLCPQVRCLHLHSYPGNKSICTNFLDFTYMCQYTFVFLFLTNFTLFEEL